MPNPHFDYEPAPGTLNVVISTEHDPPVLLGTYLGSVEDSVTYFDCGADEEHHSAPADCVRIVGITV